MQLKIGDEVRLNKDAIIESIDLRNYRLEYDFDRSYIIYSELCRPFLSYTLTLIDGSEGSEIPKEWLEKVEKVRETIKPDYSLIPADAIEEIATVLTDGTKKYEPNGWLGEFTWSHYFSKIMRHLWAFWRGEDKDPESGLSHIAHAGADLMILLAYYLRKINKDDRRG